MNVTTPNPAAARTVTAAPTLEEIEPPHHPPGRHHGHRNTPTNLPSWYGSDIAREQRSWLSKTGDVSLMAGNTFGTSYDSVDGALERARDASAGEQGAVMIMTPHTQKDAHAGQYFLTRAYNAEYRKEQGDFWIHQTQLDGTEKAVTNWHPDSLMLVDDGIVVRR